MKELKLKDNRRALVVVAHPDDETIWMGGTILRYPDVDWTIFSFCRESDDDRRPKFFRVCRRYGATGIITDLDDDNNLSAEKSILIIKKYLKDKIEGKGFDYLFTHNRNGEYGHPGHIAAHKGVRSALKDNIFNAKKTFFFNYKLVGEHKAAPGEDSDFFLKLTDDEFTEKKRIVALMYGYAPDGIDVGYCTQVEGFAAPGK